jgi:hypothetical protein
MKENMPRACLIVALTMIVPAIVMSQGQISTLMVSGHPGGVPVTQINGKNYVEIEALARMTNGSLSFSGNQITLTLPAAGEIEKAAGEAGAAAKKGFSREFLRPGIEALSTMREWHSALASAIENQFPVALSWQAPFEARATTNLRLAQVAATTDSDRNAAQLIANVYQKMRQLSDKYVAQRANLSYIAPDSLKNDALDQSIVTCGRALGAMMASGQFVDDGTCH